MKTDHYPGPVTEIAQFVHAEKHRQPGESFDDYAARVASPLAHTRQEFREFRDALGTQEFLPGGRIQASVGGVRRTTPMNCYVSGAIEDSMTGIMQRATEAAATLRLGGGIGYDFSTIRPKGDRIVSLGSSASGPVSFMRIFDAVCGTVSSAGERRGAQMAVLRIDHPDIREYIHAKRDETSLTTFNMSLGVTDEFMRALASGEGFDLKWGGRVYDTIDPAGLWEEIMRNTWDWAEPGVLFIDQINRENPLYYHEQIAATNPCGEQPLPPFGACLLGSINLTKMLVPSGDALIIDYNKLERVVRTAVTMLDRVIDLARYPLDEQAKEHQTTRRMGLGMTGLANALEACDMPYGTPEFVAEAGMVAMTIRDAAFGRSVELADEHGAFPAFDRDLYLAGPFIERLPEELRRDIRRVGIRNSHLTSIAPTGSISLGADNVSGGIEPVFSHTYTRDILQADGSRKRVVVEDYGSKFLGVKGRTAGEVSVDEHLAVQAAVAPYVDSAISKTINVGDDIDFAAFKDVYLNAWKLGLKGVTTFRAAGKRFGILNEIKPEKEAGGACYIDPETGQKECS